MGINFRDLDWHFEITDWHYVEDEMLLRIKVLNENIIVLINEIMPELKEPNIQPYYDSHKAAAQQMLQNIETELQHRKEQNNTVEFDIDECFEKIRMQSLSLVDLIKYFSQGHFEAISIEYNRLNEPGYIETFDTNAISALIQFNIELTQKLLALRGRCLCVVEADISNDKYESYHALQYLLRHCKYIADTNERLKQELQYREQHPYKYTLTRFRNLIEKSRKKLRF